MAKRPSTNFVCQNCNSVYSKWMGKCDACGEWNTIIEQLATEKLTEAGAGGRALSLKEERTIEQVKPRISTGLSNVDDVLGGGIVPGSVVLLAGQPGIGKSTLLTQLSSSVGLKNRVLYISGEESVSQVSLRASRLSVNNRNTYFISSNSASDIAATILNERLDLVVVDSIQTMNVDSVSSMTGSVSQITNSTRVLMEAAKSTSTAVLIVGHVTKEGNIAGPKLLEHIVDVVLSLEGDRYGGFKVLRSVKNRHGSTNESALFEMKEKGLMPVDNPSAALLEERQVSDGSIVLATVEGTRPMLVEVQALVNTSSYGYPKRTASGIDANRVSLLIAMLERRTKLKLSDKDIYINIVGGIKVVEPAADLAVCMAIASATKSMQLKGDAVVFGEVGLSGEIRRVNFIEKRIKEASKLGFTDVILPKTKEDIQLKNSKIRLHQVSSIKSALNQFLSK